MFEQRGFHIEYIQYKTISINLKIHMFHILCGQSLG